LPFANQKTLHLSNNDGLVTAEYAQSNQVVTRIISRTRSIVNIQLSSCDRIELLMFCGVVTVEFATRKQSCGSDNLFLLTVSILFNLYLSSHFLSISKRLRASVLY